MKLLHISLFSFLIILQSCNINSEKKTWEEIKVQEKHKKKETKQEIKKNLNLDNSKFYLLSKNKSNEYILKKTYFEEEMEVYRFENSKNLYDKTGSAIMEPLEYLILDRSTDNENIVIKTQNKWTKKNKEFNFKHDYTTGIIYELDNGNVSKAFIDSAFINSMKTIYIPPCEEYITDEYEIKDCLDEYVKDEEERRVKNNDFSWYPKLNCEKYFEKIFCERLSKVAEN